MLFEKHSKNGGFLRFSSLLCFDTLMCFVRWPP
jgi:hypothetical protein